MPYYLSDINRRAAEDPARFIAECDAHYDDKIDRTARRIAERIADCRIVLLSGPSGSGKTTTAKKIEERLGTMGIRTHTISLDNYFRDVDPLTAPRDKDGNYDFESPDCLDSPLLIEHFGALDRGETIPVPKFEFTKQKRNPERARPLRLDKNEIAIFEGIHALNDSITGHGEGRFATKVYISARSNIELNRKIIFKGTWMRILRRTIRDLNFRGSSAASTFAMWENVRRGEKAYISPYKNSAHVMFDSSFPYEVPVLKGFSKDLFEVVPEGIARYNEVFELRDGLRHFEVIDEKYLPPHSLIREFIGGGSYKYH